MTRKKEEAIKFGLVELFEEGNLDIIEELFETDYLVHAGGKNYKGHGFIKRWTRQLCSTIPDIKVLKIDFLMQAGDTIAWQRTLKGTHIKDIMGIPASKQKVEWREMVVSRFNGEKITEEWVVSELAGELLSKSPNT